MWFKQAQIFKLSQPMAYDPEVLQAALTRLAFSPCLPSFSSSHGWAAPIDQDDAPLVHASDGFMLFTLQVEEKVLPATVIRQAVNERVKKMQAEYDRKISRREKTDLKEEITQSLLPRAFSRFSRINAYIDTKRQWLVVDTASSTKLELFSKMFQRSCPDDQFAPLSLRKLPPILTSWVLNQSYPGVFGIEKSAVLRDPNLVTRQVRCQQQDLFSSAIKNLIKEGFEISQLSINWQDRVVFQLDEFGALKTIRYLDEILALAKDHYSETESERFDADFFIMTKTLTQLFDDLYETLILEEVVA
jgi:recombination associated protein RdgC